MSDKSCFGRGSYLNWPAFRVDCSEIFSFSDDGDHYGWRRQWLMNGTKRIVVFVLENDLHYLLTRFWTRIGLVDGDGERPLEECPEMG